MAFDFSSFFGGLIEGAGEQVEKKNKEIRETTNNELENLYKKAEENSKKNQTQRDKLKELGGALSSYRGKNNSALTDAQIIGIMQNPNQAKKVMEVLDSRSKDGTIDTLDFNEMFKVVQGKTDKTWQDFISTTTAPSRAPQTDAQKKAEAENFKVPTAFGLPSNAASRAQQQFEKVSGKSVSQLRAEAAGPREIADEDRVGVDVEWGKLAKPRSNEAIQNDLRDSIANGKGLDHPDNQKLMKQLAAAATVKSLSGDDPRSTSEIRSGINAAIKNGMNPLLGKFAMIDRNTGEVMPINTPGKPENMAAFMKHKNNIIKEQMIQTGQIDASGKILGGRNAEDALAPYAVIQKGKIIEWRGEKINKPSPEAIAALRANPNMAPDFEIKYPGYSAAQYLTNNK